MDATQDDVTALADRLSALEMTDGEREVLRVMASAAAAALGSGGDEAEVSGFFFSENGHRSLKAGGLDFGPMTLKLGPPTSELDASSPKLSSDSSPGDGQRHR